MTRKPMLWLAAMLAVLMQAAPAQAADSEYRSLELPDEARFEESWVTGNKLHMYLGLGSMAAAIVAGVTAPEAPEGVVVPPSQRKNARSTTHHIAALTAAALGGAAIASGLMLHWDDITNSFGLTDPDILHLVLGLVGTAGYVYAITKGPKRVGDPSNGHSAAGILGAAAMATAITLEW